MLLLRIKKPAPGIPRTVLLEPYLFYQETLCIAHEDFQFRFCAVSYNPQRTGEVQAEQLHEALGVDLVVFVTNGDGEATGGGQCHEILNILNASQPDLKFSHKSAPLNLYKKTFFVYNGEQRSKNRPNSSQKAVANYYSSFL